MIISHEICDDLIFTTFICLKGFLSDWILNANGFIFAGIGSGEFAFLSRRAGKMQPSELRNKAVFWDGPKRSLYTIMMLIPRIILSFSYKSARHAPGTNIYKQINNGECNDFHQLRLALSQHCFPRVLRRHLPSTFAFYSKYRCRCFAWIRTPPKQLAVTISSINSHCKI